MRVAILIFCLTALAVPATAQPRDLPVPLGKGWQHADSGVVLTATLAGLPRTTLTDNGSDERDIAAEFAGPRPRDDRDHLYLPPRDDEWPHLVRPRADRDHGARRL